MPPLSRMGNDSPKPETRNRISIPSRNPSLKSICPVRILPEATRATLQSPRAPASPRRDNRHHRCTVAADPTALVLPPVRRSTRLARHSELRRRHLQPAVCYCRNLLPDLPSAAVSAKSFRRSARTPGLHTLHLHAHVRRTAAHRLRLGLLSPRPRQRPPGLGPPPDHDRLHGAGRRRYRRTRQRESWIVASTRAARHRYRQRLAMASQRSARARRSPFLRRRAGLCHRGPAAGASASAELHPWLGLRRSRRPIYSRQDFGDFRSAGFRSRPHYKRPHSETPGRRHRQLLDSKNAREERTKERLAFALIPLT